MAEFPLSTLPDTKALHDVLPRSVYFLRKAIYNNFYIHVNWKRLKVHAEKPTCSGSKNVSCKCELEKTGTAYRKLHLFRVKEYVM